MDIFVNMPQELSARDFDNYARNMGEGIRQGNAYRGYLDSKAEALVEQIYATLRSGNYQRGHKKWNAREVENVLRDAVSVARTKSVISAWQEILKNPAKLSRLQAMRDEG